MSIGTLVKIVDDQDGIQGLIALVIDKVPNSDEVVVELVTDNSLWIYFPNQLEELNNA
jgi:hypothetical protein